MPSEALTSDDCPRVGDMPVLGLGTWQNSDPETCQRTIETALELGYRHFDTAQAYDNERAIGEAIASSPVPRSECFLASKVWIDSLGYDDVIEAAKASCERLGVSRLDLLYVHWPARTYDPVDTLAAMDELVDSGIIERVGVSNFEPEQLDVARQKLDADVHALQVEMHPLLPQAELREYCLQADIELVAYSPLARGAVFDVPEISTVAERRTISEAKVCLAWLREKGVAAVPKATGESHLRDNWESLRVSLEPEDIATIDGIDRRQRIVDPGFAPW